MSDAATATSVEVGRLLKLMICESAITMVDRNKVETSIRSNYVVDGVSRRQIYDQIRVPQG